MERIRIKRSKIPICTYLGKYGVCKEPDGASAATVVESIQGSPFICGVHVLGKDYCNKHPAIIIAKSNIPVLGSDTL